MFENNKIQEISINKIVENKFQPRMIFQDDMINELAKSIDENGLLQPVTVRKVGTNFELIAGERRLTAFRLLKRDKIPAIIISADDNQSSKLALIENIQRENLTSLEEAIAYINIMNLDNISQGDLAKKLGKTQGSISNKIRLLKLDEEVQKLIYERKLTERHARSLLKIKDDVDQIRCARRIVESNLTVSQAEKLVEKFIEGNFEHKGPITQSRNKNSNIQKMFYNDIQKKVEDTKLLGVSVKISSKYDAKGKLVIKITI